MKKILLLITIAICTTNITLAQNVGIGTNTPDPSAQLEVQSTNAGILIPRMTSAQRIAIVNAAEGLLVYDTETLNVWVYKDAGWSEIKTDAGATTNFWNTDGNHIYNNNTGNVGIGTTNPTTLLTLQTPINTLGFRHVGGADSIIVTEGIGGVSASIGTTTNHSFRLNAGGQGRMSIYPTGDVVVGDNSSGSFGKFSVQTLNNSYGISHLGEGGNILATRMGGTSAGIGTFSNTHMRIFANGISAITITGSNGNVGVGIDFPVNKFEVNGTIRSKELIVESINWPDYVFDEKYKLPLLSDVEKFIHQNKHLPNIPSSAEIEKTGLHLGDTQKRMMEKIEELTLYMIEANEQIRNSKKEIETLKNKITTLENFNLRK